MDPLHTQMPVALAAAAPSMALLFLAHNTCARRGPVLLQCPPLPLPQRAAAAAVVLLLQALAGWRASIGPSTPADVVPRNAAERAAFKACLASMRRLSGEDGIAMDVRHL